MELQPTLKNDLVVVRPLQLNDFSDLYLQANNKEIWAQLPPRAQNRYKQPDFADFFNNLMKTNTAFCILDAKTQCPIGTTKYYIHNNLLYMGGTFIGRKYWGGKYNYAFRSLLIDYAFDYYDKIHIHISENNIRNRQATLKLGFTEEFKEIFKNGYTYITYRCKKDKWYNK